MGGGGMGGVRVSPEALKPQMALSSPLQRPTRKDWPVGS